MVSPRPLAATLAVAALTLTPLEAIRVEVLESSGGLPAHIAGVFSEPLAFQQAADGTSFVFDRRAHAVYRVDAKTQALRKIVEIGFEEGRLLEPSAFDLEPGGSVVVADGPNGRERVQIFRPDLDPHQPAGDGIAHHRVHALRRRLAHHRPPAANRTRGRSRSAPRPERRAAACSARRRALRRLHRRRADVPEVREGRPTRVLAAH